LTKEVVRKLAHAGCWETIVYSPYERGSVPHKTGGDASEEAAVIVFAVLYTTDFVVGR